ncbi:MAG: Holliday junction resolvase RuvX [Spirochaetales bacterium]|nr:Holliday junction resolvase RuvX [Spirochaetales bacterium]
MGRILGVDLGKKRVGLAISDPLQMISQPFKTLIFTSLARLIKEIKLIIRENDVEEIVVGLPVKESGEEGQGCIEARRFARLLESEQIQVTLWDERYSSRLAENVLKSHGKKRKGNQAKIDKIAASFILESFLKSKSSG